MTQLLGEFRTVQNTFKQHAVEADRIIVGHICVDGTLMAIALTEEELVRPHERGERNIEDMPQLSIPKVVRRPFENSWLYASSVAVALSLGITIGIFAMRAFQ